MILNNPRFPFTLLLCFTLAMSNLVVYGKDKPAICLENFTDSLQMDKCADSFAIEKIIGDAIELGAPIYNAGLHLGCYRIYEWAAYKILYVYGSSCSKVETILKTAIERSHGDYSDIEKAWMMRAAFDKILGVPTKTGNADKDLNKREYPQKG